MASEEHGSYRLDDGEIRDDVRARRMPPTTGPHLRHLLVAVAGLLIAVGALALLVPRGRPPAEPARTAPAPPDHTFLDAPAADAPRPDTRAPWWQRFTAGDDSLPEEGSPPPDAFTAWPDDTAPAPVSTVMAAPDPRKESLARALRSASLQRVDAPLPRPGGGVPATDAEPLLAAAAAALPKPADLAALLESARQNASGAPAATVASGGGGATERGPFFVHRTSVTARRLLRAGTVIPARLETAIDSDTPGPVIARVVRDVTDSTTGQEVLIPAGAVLLGSFGRELSIARDRALVAFEHLSWPGISLEVPGLQALAASGTRGLSDQVNHHTFALLGRAALLAVVGAGFEIAQPQRSAGEALAPGDLVAARTALELDRVAAEILERGLDRPPTVHVRPGERFAVYLHRDLIFD